MPSAEAARLDQAIACLEQRFGSHTVVRTHVFEQRRQDRRISTGTSFDRIADGGLAIGSPTLFLGGATSGKLSLALTSLAAAQRDGGMALWVDPTSSFDPTAAWRVGVQLERLVVLRSSRREDVLLAAGAALRGDGFRLVVVDCGPSIAPDALSIDQLAPLVPLSRGASTALLLVAEEPSVRLALPSFHFERVAWRRRFERTAGWTFAVSRANGLTALFESDVRGSPLHDIGVRDASGLEIAV